MDRPKEDIELSKINSRIASGAFWFFTGTVARAVLRVFVIVALARLLTPAEFGLVGAAAIFIMIFDLLATPGAVFTIVQFRSMEQRHVGTAFVNTMVTSILAVTGLYICAPYLARAIAMPELTEVLRVLCFVLPLNAISVLCQKILERHMEFRRIALIEFLGYFLGYAWISVTLATLGFGIWSLIYAQVATAGLRCAVTFWSQPYTPFVGANHATFLETLRPGVGFTLARSANTAAQKGDYFVVGRLLGVEALGIYERAYVLMDLSNNLVTNSLSTILFSAFSRLQGDIDALRKAYLRACSLLILLFAPISGCAAILAPEIIHVLLGNQWGAVVEPFRIMALAMIFRTGYKIANVTINSTGRVYRNAASQAVFAVAIIGGAYLAAPWGVEGVAVSSFLALGLFFVLTTSNALKVTKTPIKTFLSRLIPPLGAGLVAGILIFVLATSLRQTGVTAMSILIVCGGSMVVCVGSIIWSLRRHAFREEWDILFVTLLNRISRIRRNI